jgi:hypothetical protein
VFLLHKVHHAQHHCYGYSLHVEAPKDNAEMRKQWLANQHSRDDYHTDLLYQLKQVMVKCSQIDDTRMAFVMCSSKLKVANSIMVRGSGNTDGDFIRFCDMHWFTAQDVRLFIEEYFDLPVELFTEERMKDIYGS